MFIWFWFPNTIFQALHSFNWMTWISPQNFNLAMVTGFYGGLGINPWATFDWNVSGSNGLVTPVFSIVQKYIGGLLGGLSILGIYYNNLSWTAYLPLNSNAAFDNTGKTYNISSVLGDDGLINVQKYLKYGPPYYSAAMMLEQGGWYTTYVMILTYVFVRNWTSISKQARNFWTSIQTGTPTLDAYDDAHCRLMRVYPEAPDWWFLVVLVSSIAFGILAATLWPTNTPWWSVLCVTGVSAAFAIPTALLNATANVAVAYKVLYQLLAGAWFLGNPQAQMIVSA